MYAMDSRDTMLPTFWTGPSGQVSLIGGGYWKGPAVDIAVGMSEASAMELIKAGMQTAPLWSYCPALGANHCPGDLRTKQLRPGYGWAYDSYSKADTMNGAQWDNSPGHYYVKTTEVRRQTDALVFTEEWDHRGFNVGTWAFNIGTMTFQDTFAIFHGNVTTFAFVDGHVESHRWLEASTIQAVKTHTHNWATGDVRKNRDFLWLWNHYQYPTWKPL
jgi:prepilin-type processing-associated H-X9-DG protein